MIEAYHKLSDENSRLHQQLVETQRLYKECEEFKESLVEDVKRLREENTRLRREAAGWKYGDAEDFLAGQEEVPRGSTTDDERDS